MVAYGLSLVLPDGRWGQLAPPKLVREFVSSWSLQQTITSHHPHR
jgi:hypothetical protein